MLYLRARLFNNQLQLLVKLRVKKSISVPHILKRQHSFISGSTVIEKTSAASRGRFRNLYTHLVQLLWTSDEPVT
jgi:hypothetical protein